MRAVRYTQRAFIYTRRNLRGSDKKKWDGHLVEDAPRRARHLMGKMPMPRQWRFILLKVCKYSKVRRFLDIVSKLSEEGEVIWRK